MRRPALTLAVAAVAISGASFLATVSEAEAQSRRSRAVVVIQPRYLTAGTQVSPNEYRASVPEADARFRSSSVGVVANAGGLFPWVDPFYLPYPHSTIQVDTPFGRRLPGEQ